MGCTVCKSPGCIDGKDCFGIKDRSMEIYSTSDNRAIIETATRVRKTGRTKSKSRIEEIVLYCQQMGYNRIGVAYCYTFPDEANNIEEILKEGDLYPVMLQCTTGGLTEDEVANDSGEEVISCNPAGQAILLEQQGVDFVIEVGLCLGHDVIFHDTLHVPFTTLIVKDRLLANNANNNNPAVAFFDYGIRSREFLESLNDTSYLLTTHKLAEIIEAGKEDLVVIDLRPESMFKKESIPASINVPLEELPELFRKPDITRDDMKKKVVCYCNDGSVASFATMYLFQLGFQDISCLKGGLKRWKKEGYSIDEKEEVAVSEFEASEVRLKKPAL